MRPASLALLLLAAACGGRSQPAPGAPAPEPAAEKEAKASLLSRLPAGATVAGGLRPGNLAEDGPLGAALAKDVPELAALSESCGIDHLEDVREVAVAFPPEGAFVLGIDADVERERAEDCFTSHGAEVSRRGDLTVVVEGGATTYVTRSEGIWLAAESEALLASAGEGGGLEANETLMAYVERTDPEAAIWAAGEVPEQVRAQFPSNAAPVGFTLSVRAPGETIDLDATLVLLGEEEAAELRAIVEQALSQVGQDPMIADIAGKLEIEQNAHELALRLSLTDEDVETIRRLLASLPVR